MNWVLMTSGVTLKIDSERLSALFAEWDNDKGPGGAVAILSDGEVVFRKGYGLADVNAGRAFEPDSVCRIASTTKQFTTTLILLLQERGLLCLNDAIRNYIPELQFRDADLTIKQLCQNISGIRDHLNLINISGGSLTGSVTGGGVKDLIIHQESLQFSPGVQFRYSNSNFVILSWIIERLMGMPFADCLKAEIFEPLGMTSTALCEYAKATMPPGAVVAYLEDASEGWIPNPRYQNVSLLGEGGVVSTVDDMLLWEKNFDQNIIGSPRLLEGLKEGAVLKSGQRVDYGLGLFSMEFDGVKVEGHPGMLANIRSSRLRLPDHGLSVIALCNHPGSSPMDLSLRAIKGLLGGVESGSSPPPTDSQSCFGQQYCGTYSNPDTGFSLQLLIENTQPLLNICGVDYLLEFDGDATYASGPANIDRPAAVRLGAVDGQILISSGNGPFCVYGREPGREGGRDNLLGRYYCKELKTTYSIEKNDDGIVASAAGPIGVFDNRVLEPIAQYVFLLDIENEGKANLRFSVQGDGRVLGFHLGGDRSEGLYFSKIPS